MLPEMRRGSYRDIPGGSGSLPVETFQLIFLGRAVGEFSRSTGISSWSALKEESAKEETRQKVLERNHCPA